MGQGGSVAGVGVGDLGEAEKGWAEPLGAKWLAEILSRGWRQPGDGPRMMGGVVVPQVKGWH